MDYTREFEYFWRVFPKRWDRTRSRWIKRKKAPAFEKWQRLDEDIRHEILTKAVFIKDFEGSAARDAVTWLNQEGWDDIEFKTDWVPQLPEELTKGTLKNGKILPINTNNERNRLRKELEG